MKNKGFTLVELLAVLAIIAIIGLIVVPTVNRTIQNSREQLYQTQIDNIRSAGKAWAIENISLLPETSSDAAAVVTLAQLVEGGYIEANTENPITRKKFSGTLTEVTISKSGNQYIYEVTAVDES